MFYQNRNAHLKSEIRKIAVLAVYNQEVSVNKPAFKI